MITGLKKLYRVRRIILVFLYPTFFVSHLDIVENFLKKDRVGPKKRFPRRRKTTAKNHGEKAAFGALGWLRESCDKSSYKPAFGSPNMEPNTCKDCYEQIFDFLLYVEPSFLSS